MANKFSYGSSGYGAEDGGGYSSLAGAGDSYFSSYSGSNRLAPSSEFGKYSSGGALDHGSSIYSTGSALGSVRSIYSQWGGVDGAGDVAGVKRSADALYHQSILGSHNTIGQSDGLFSTNSMFKHPRYETASNLPIYPQRPGEKDCAHYMLTRTCKFGEACKFDHPIWVPEGGIPDWKEVLLAPTEESLPERPGEPDCPYFMKTQKCKFGYRCKFNHPKYLVNQGVEFADTTTLPERPSEPICSFYAKTGKCKFGANCKFHHPKDLQIPSSGQDTGSLEQTQSAVQNIAAGYSMLATTFVPSTPALLHNSKGLPIRPGETDCPFYLKTGSCKFGATCRFNHPDRTGNTMMPYSTASLPIGLINPVASLMPGLDPLLARASFGVGPTVYPQRPGQMECDFYMKTGHCKFGETCKFHHPVDRTAPAASVAKQDQPNVKLTLAGLPRREGTVACPFYMKTGTCKYGGTCRYDHPPPGEAIARATVQGGAATAASGKETDDAEEQ
ncbi:zinc finger CCCH domain-containing protein 8 [Iris pallida]|uniref:Zinc finger CCCH domain-containing protein 8 n=1 Tax=Iris pallida TaxID=29817 RepID=A0AAX6HIX6_IRIPA|nr:zinc finger CCCH domain-containing protein 8 [Iris pallida]KAJ6852817.1 zinc finger CCCH domain-containing protein 8 [Iris pallida]